jgi:hypothetical protein
MNTLRSIYPLMIQQYETFIPNIEGMEITQKINSIIQYLNRIGKLNNDVVADWNKVMTWVMGEGLTDAVNTKVDDLIAKGTFDDLLQTMFDDINTANTTFQNTINGQVNTLTSQMAENASYLVDYVNPVKYGAKFNGIDDDAPALTTALQYGNVKIPQGKTVTIKSTVQINKPQRIIDGGECIVNVSDNVIAFQVGTLTMTASLLNIVLKNMFVVMGNSSSFFLSYNSYFIKLDNIRVTGLTGNGYAAKIYNGFNVTFQEFHIGGKASTPAETNISGNTATGIHIYLSTIGVNPAVSGTVNATNILFDSCLIQRVQYGIKYEVVDGTFDSNKITNVGFSNCDYVFYETGGADSRFLNQEISTIRAEYCGTMFTNIGYLTVTNAYGYNTDNLIDNQLSASLISFKGKVFHWNPAKPTGCSVIKTNLGLIDLSGADFVNYTTGTNQKSASGVYGNIIPTKATYKKRANGLTTLTINPLSIDIIDQTTYLNFTNISGYTNGSEFYIMSSNGSTVTLPDGTDFRFIDSASSILRCMVVNNAIVIDGKTSIFSTNTISTNSGITMNNKIDFVTATATVGTFSFNKTGIVILSSATNGVKLGNSNSTIINFADVLPNGATQIDLYNNVCILMPSGRNDGKGYVITMPSVTHSV